MVARLSATGGEDAERIAEAAYLLSSFPAFLTAVRIDNSAITIDADDPEERLRQYEAGNWESSGQTPFRRWWYLLETAQSWERGENEVICKTRQIGFSWLGASYAVYRMLRQPQALTLLFSQGKLEAAELLRKCRVVWESLPPTLKGQLAQDNIYALQFANGSRIMAMPATERAGRSFTASLVIVDEAAFHPYAAENYRAYRPTVEAGGQILIISTGNGPVGWFYDQFWAAWNGQTGYRARFYPWWVRPGRHLVVQDREQDPPNVIRVPDERWREQERRNWPKSIDEFTREYPATPEDAFVAPKGLVYPEFNRDTHVVYHHPFQWEDTKIRVAGVDLGGSQDPSAVIIQGVSIDNRIHEFGEAYWTEPIAVEDVVNALMPWHRVAPFHSIECPPEQRTFIESLRRAGLPARAADNARDDGIRACRELLQAPKGRWTIHNECYGHLSEFPGYRVALKRDPHTGDRFPTKTPIEHHGDAMDGWRYGSIRIVQHELRGFDLLQPLGGGPRPATLQDGVSEPPRRKGERPWDQHRRERKRGPRRVS